MMLHSDQITISQEQVRSLIKAQFPQWSALPIAGAPVSGTDHAIFRLGDELTIRLPLRPAASGQVLKEQAWLPRIEPALTVPIPTPVAVGGPGAGYPLAWSICKWLEGENPSAELGANALLGAQLGAFISTLRSVTLDGGPKPGEHNFGRGAPLAIRDLATRTAIDQLDGTIDTRKATAIWDSAIGTASRWKPAWIHGDLCPGNILVRGAELSGILDFGGLAVGDPACDLMIAWNFLTDAARDAFRQEVAVDVETWERGRAWALSVALIQLPYYGTSNLSLAATARSTIESVLT